MTTNFDRLLERALEAVGVAPIVIDTPDAAEGAPPLQHSACTVVKVNGDYLDTRIKNTPEELGEYDDRIKVLLDEPTTVRLYTPASSSGRTIIASLRFDPLPMSMVSAG